MLSKALEIDRFILINSITKISFKHIILSAILASYMLVMLLPQQPAEISDNIYFAWGIKKCSRMVTDHGKTKVEKKFAWLSCPRGWTEVR